jgi:hypothetical protein
MKEEKAKERILPNFEALKNEIFRNYQKAANRRNYVWNLSKEEFFTFLESKCYYCGTLPNTSWYGGNRTIMDTSKFKYNGVDRVDNNTGYFINNCVSCCKTCNNAKAALSVVEFYNWINRVYQNQLGRSTTSPKGRTLK